MQGYIAARIGAIGGSPLAKAIARDAAPLSVGNANAFSR